MAGPDGADAEVLDVGAVGERIETLLQASAAGGTVARERAEELVRLVADLYGAGLERILDVVHEQGHLDDGVLEALADDQLVSSLLLVHGLHPYDVTTRVERALADVRPYLGSHDGDVELISVSDDGVVTLRLLGSCDGCPSSSATLSLAVEGAVQAAAPEVTAIEVEAAESKPAKSGSVISLDSLRSRIDVGAAPSGSSWEIVDEFATLAPGQVMACVVGDAAVLGCRIGDDLYAFGNECAQCSNPLTGATMGRRLGGGAGDAVLSCPHCHAHYDVRRAGAGLDDATAHLAPLPLLRSGATTSVSVPTPVSA